MQNYSNNLINGIPVREGQDETLNQLYWDLEGQNIEQFQNSGMSSGFLLNDVSQSQHLHQQNLLMQQDPQTWFPNSSSCHNLSFIQDQLNFFSPRDLINDPISTTSASSSSELISLPPCLETAPRGFTGQSEAASWPSPTAGTFSVVGNSSQLFSGGFESTRITAAVAGNMSAGASTEPLVPAEELKGKRIDMVEFVNDEAEMRPKIAKKIQTAERRRMAEKRRRENINDRINALIGLTPGCKGSRGDKFDMIICHLLSVKDKCLSLKQENRSLHQENQSLKQQLQYAKTAMAFQRMMHQYTMRANPASGSSTGLTFSVPNYQADPPRDHVTIPLQIYEQLIPALQRLATTQGQESEQPDWQTIGLEEALARNLGINHQYG